ncbi:hypothetical protein [Microvirga thermotolerans]|uniref:Uncharacterized protein n=1 Tax=Microvirga thermotolerans TaxID=2651334 RepID=A0A5P9JYL6_9HYPH|nr:hypothetical protein [Microvirga thermotolerans]QFU16838.1 hypothetical protein GDR74_11695 [Microvirga thermotolerans]
MPVVKPPMAPRFFSEAAKRNVIAMAAVAAGLSFPILPAQASHNASHPSAQGVARHDSKGDAKLAEKSGQRTAATLAAKDPEVTGSIGAADRPNCNRSRMKLWVEGEGWMVRPVTTCY